MWLPYTSAPADAFMAAQTSLAAVISAIVWRRPLRPLAASVAMLAAVWLATLTPILPSILSATCVVKLPANPTSLLLGIAATFATASMLLNRPRWFAWIALAGQLGLAWVGRHVANSDGELASLHVVWFAALIGGHIRFNHPQERAREPIAPGRSFFRQDIVVFACAVALALIVGRFVLHWTCDSADEWAYRWQALLLARFKAFVPVPSCGESHRSHWIFYYQGRAFGMYLPGWPLVMAPFERARMAWLVSPLFFGAMVVGVARLARRVSGEAAGIAAAIAATLGASVLMNAGSYYCHCFIAALFAWLVESVCACTTVGLGKRAQLGWGVVMGTAAGLALGTRPSDAGVLGIGAFMYFVYAFLKGQVRVRTLIGATASFALFGGICVLILRAQLGEWFKTGYSIAELYVPWAKASYSVPPRDAWKYGLPLMTTAYCFWPASPALGAAGLIIAGKRVSFMLALATVMHLAFYCALNFGRYGDFGYGPRYYIVLVVPLAVGTGVMLGPFVGSLLSHFRAWSFGSIRNAPSAPATLALAAVVVGVLRIAPLMYPFAHDLLHKRSALRRAIDEAHLHHAVVTIRQHEVDGGPLLDTQNDPLDPNPEVLVLSGDDMQCIRALYPDRTFYRAQGIDEVDLIPY